MPNFTCVRCVFSTESKFLLNKHELTAKHIRLQNTTEEYTPPEKIHQCQLCKNKFTCKRNLCTHMKKCATKTHPPPAQPVNNITTIDVVNIGQKQAADITASQDCPRAKNELPQYIYLLQEIEFIKTNESVYKIGRTKQKQNDRFCQYPKGSQLLLQILSNDCRIDETKLLVLFKKKYKLRRDIGNEYFEGDSRSMIKTICDELNNID